MPAGEKEDPRGKSEVRIAPWDGQRDPNTRGPAEFGLEGGRSRRARAVGDRRPAPDRPATQIAFERPGGTIPSREGGENPTGRARVRVR